MVEIFFSKCIFSETLNLGNRLGLDPAVLSQIINAASGRCWSSDTYNPVPGVIETVPSSNGYKGGFGTTLMTKVRLYSRNFPLVINFA